jgi:hypothetical protein
MTLLEDNLSDTLKIDNRKVVTQQLYQDQFDRDTSHQQVRLRTPKNAIYSLRDVYGLIKQAVDNYEERAGTPTSEQVTFTEEKPDRRFQGEVISVSCISSQPGSFAKGPPLQGGVKNLKPIFREEVDDPDVSGYKIAVLGYWYESVIRLTCWAHTNKAANARVDWLQNLMLDYDWWFCAEGISRIIFLERGEDKVLEIDDNKWYGRPLDYFVKTEKIKMLSEREIEEIYITLTMSAY